jgi:hypothetical protein
MVREQERRLGEPSWEEMSEEMPGLGGTAVAVPKGMTTDAGVRRQTGTAFRGEEGGAAASVGEGNVR